MFFFGKWLCGFAGDALGGREVGPDVKAPSKRLSSAKVLF